MIRSFQPTPVNFTGANAGTTYTSPNTQRNGYCCTASGVDKCVHFVVTTDSNTTEITMSICSGTIPSGALFYEIDCTTLVPMGDTATISPGIHDITFCKVGVALNTYCLTSLPQNTTFMTTVSATDILTVTPNPFSQSALISIRNRQPGDYSLEIYDVTGKLVRKDPIDAPQAVINRHSLVNGMYFYVLRKDYTMAGTGKFMIE